MAKTPHRDKLAAAIENPKSRGDIPLLREAFQEYERWLQKISHLRSTGKQRVLDATRLLNEYKDTLEVELIAARGSDFLKRQKGQLKIDNSVLEEFLIHLVDPEVITGLPPFALEIGPHTAFMTFSFRPASINSLAQRPEIVVKSKDQDFTIGKTIHYRLSPEATFPLPQTEQGELFLSVLSAEVKVNY